MAYVEIASIPIFCELMLKKRGLPKKIGDREGWKVTEEEFKVHTNRGIRDHGFVLFLEEDGRLIAEASCHFTERHVKDTIEDLKVCLGEMFCPVLVTRMIIKEGVK